MIKILDCTLRDGGYLNNWNFGKANIAEIINLLSKANVDYIECGFLKNVQYNPDIALFNNAKLLNKLNKSRLTLMLNYGEDTSNINYDKNVEIRLAFKPHQLSKIKNFIKPLIDEGYMLSLNPMHIGLYKESELETLVNITNDLNPTCLTPVDTMGILTPDETERIFRYLDNNISKNIPFGFHSHDNLGLSKDNIIKLLKMNINRDIIIDTSVNGISRGGGMFPTEDMAIFLNVNNDGCYKIQPIETLNRLTENIVPAENKTDKKAYYLSAKYKCHPNYANYLLSKGYPISNMSDIFEKIPEENKILYSQNVIEDILSKNNLKSITR